MIDENAIEKLVQQHIGEVLPPRIVHALARSVLRKQLSQLTLKEAARWLKWKSPESLRRALSCAGVDKIKGCPVLTYTVPDLVAFREQHRVKGRRSKLQVVRRAA